MDASEVLIDGIGRSLEVCQQVLAGLSRAQVDCRPAADANSIGWLVWHLARQQDVQIAQLAGTDQVWFTGNWVGRFGLDLPRDSMGYGHTSTEAAKVSAEPALLLGYLDAATTATVSYLRGLQPTALDDVIDDSWDPPVTRGVRLVSIVDDAAQHAGQAAYVRGLLPQDR